MDRFELYTHDLNERVGAKEEERFRGFLKRRLAGEPLAYIVGEKEFWSRPFKVGRGCLIPRPETELVVEEALSFLRNYPRKRPRILDLGTGSGCIAITIALELSGWGRDIAPLVLATDISWKTLAYAKENILLLGAGSWVTPILCNWMECFSKDSLDIIVSNPPYIGEGERATLQEELEFEPQDALFSGDDGLYHIKKTVKEAYSRLVKGGILVVELGIGQARRLMEEERLLLERYQGYWTAKDLLGIERVIVLQK